MPCSVHSHDIFFGRGGVMSVTGYRIDDLGSYWQLNQKHQSAVKTIRDPLLCGDTISLADATLYPTAVFAKYMLPQFFQWKESDVLGPRLTQWYHHLSDHVPVAQRIQAEILAPLEAWKANGRWNPILAEINQSYH